MSLVFAGVCSHAPGITGRAALADPALRDAFHAAFRAHAAKRSRDAARRADRRRRRALRQLLHEQHAGLRDRHGRALRRARSRIRSGSASSARAIPGNADLSRRLIREVMQTVDVAYAEEWKFDHGIMVPLHFLTPQYDLPVIPVNINCQGPPLTPLHRAWAFGEALRRACDAVPERIALVGTGGISHWPATPDSGKINEAWDRDFLDRWARQRPRGAARPTADEADLPRRRAGRLRDPHLHRRRRRPRPRQARVSADPDLLAAAFRCFAVELHGRDHDRRSAAMPHLVILYTANLEAATTDDALCRSARRHHLAQRDDGGKQVFPTGGIRVLAYPAAHFAVRRRQAPTTPSSTSTCAWAAAARAKRAAATGERCWRRRKAHFAAAVRRAARSASRCRSTRAPRCSTPSTATCIRFSTKARLTMLARDTIAQLAARAARRREARASRCATSRSAIPAMTIEDGYAIQRAWVQLQAAPKAARSSATRSA